VRCNGWVMAASGRGYIPYYITLASGISTLSRMVVSNCGRPPPMKPPETIRLTPGKRVLYLTKDPVLIERQLAGELDLTMADLRSTTCSTTSTPTR
jgi:hypothetical protein